YTERAAYVVQGDVTCAGVRAGPGRMLVFAAGTAIGLSTPTGARVVLIGGEPVGERHIYWNFVASSLARIEQAKRDWREGRFPKVPGDDLEFIPLPEST
ncbi:Pirin domain protein, partial [mine drainage metagenome]